MAIGRLLGVGLILGFAVAGRALAMPRSPQLHRSLPDDPAPSSREAAVSIVLALLAGAGVIQGLTLWGWWDGNLAVLRETLKEDPDPIGWWVARASAARDDETDPERRDADRIPSSGPVVRRLAARGQRPAAAQGLAASVRRMPQAITSD